MKRPLPPSRTAGFTLLEILLAMTLLGVVTALVTGGLSFGSRVWDREQRQLADWSDLQATQDVLRRLLSQALPLRSAGGTGLQVRSFTGDDGQVRFLGPPPARSVRGGIYEYIIRRRSEPDGSFALVLTWRLRPPDIVRSRPGAGNRTGAAPAASVGDGGTGSQGGFGRSRFGSGSRTFGGNADSGLFSGTSGLGGSRSSFGSGRSRLGEDDGGDTGLSGNRSRFGGRAGDGLGGRLRDRDRPEQEPPVEAGDAADAAPARPVNEVVLAKHLRTVRFTYFGKSDEQDRARWRDRWLDSASAPTLLRLDVEFPQRDPRRWPDLIIAPLLSTPSGQG